VSLIEALAGRTGGLARARRHFGAPKWNPHAPRTRSTCDRWRGGRDDGACSCWRLSVPIIQALTALPDVSSSTAKPSVATDRGGRAGPGGRCLFYYDRAWQAFDQSLRVAFRRTRKPHEIARHSAPAHVFLRTGLKPSMTPIEPDVEKASALLVASRVPI